MADKGQKTEQPTDRRLQKAREEGNFPSAREFVSSIQFTAFVMLAAAFSTTLLQQGRRLIRFLLARGFETEVTNGEVVRTFREVLFPTAAWLLAAGAMLVVVSLAAQLATTRMGLTLKKLTPDAKRLSPLQKLKNLPRQNVPQFFQSLVLLPLFLAAVYVVVNENLAGFLRLPLLSVESGLSLVGGSIESLLWRAAALFLVIGCIDLVRQRRRYKKDLRMTKQEVRDEYKEVEGNPQIKGRIRRLQRELLRRQMMSEIQNATAVVVNPTHYSVAIRYDMNAMGAPRVVAKGKNYLALRIRQRAMDHEVPIVENPPLAQALYKSVDVGQDIPVHLYRAVAEILAYIYRLMNSPVPATS